MTNLGERLAALETEMRSVKSDIGEFRTDMRKLLDAANMTNGAWWALLRFAGIIIAVAGLVGWLIDHVPGKIRFAIAALFLIVLSGSGFAQNVQQSGQVVPGHTGAWVTSGVMKDAGTSSNPQLNAVATYGSNGCPLSVTSTTAPGIPTGQYVQGCLSANSSTGVTLSVLPSGGLPTLPFNLNLNGTTYAFGGTDWLSNIIDQQFGSTQGSLLYRSATDWRALVPGTSGYVLGTGGPNANPSWVPAGGTGTVTQVNTGTGLSGGPVITSGTISLQVPVVVSNGGTGGTSFTQHGVVVGNGSSPLNVTGTGSSGQVLTSNGASADPTFQSVAGTGTVTSVGSGTGLTGGPITGSGSLSLATATNNTIKSNISGITASPVDNTLTAIIDSAVSSTEGSILYRSASVWAALGPGTSGNFLQTQGVGADPQWATQATATPTPLAITGFLPSLITGNSTTGTLTVSAGTATASGNTSQIANALTESWAVANGNAINGYSGGTTLPNSATIHFNQCQGTSGVGVYAYPNTSFTPATFSAANCPSGYTSATRHSFSLNTSSSGALLSGTATEEEGGSYEFAPAATTLDINVTNQGSTRIAYTLTVPVGMVVGVRLRATSNVGSTFVALITGGDETDVAPSTQTSSGGGWFNGAAPGFDLDDASSGIGAASREYYRITNTSGQIGVRAAAASGHLSVVTQKWKDFRRN